MTGFRFVIFPNDADCFFFFLNGKRKIFETTHKKRGGAGGGKTFTRFACQCDFWSNNAPGKRVGNIW